MASAIIGKDTQSGQALSIGDSERRSGLYILGKPGMGKSALMVNLMLQDLEHGHGLFFLDPHGDAISDLIKRSDSDKFGQDLLDNGVLVNAFQSVLNELTGDESDTNFLDRQSQSTLLLNPENETHSFGINLLACRDITSLAEREDTYKRAYNVFYTLWKDSWGPWLQLILEQTLAVFIENPDYTLAEVPLFLTNTEFRNHLLKNVRYQREVADFWRHEFGARRERDQQEQVQAALTRVRTLLNRRYVRDIIGQKRTTVNFSELLDSKSTILVYLSANLAPDIKKFIGAILISELVHAVRNRPEDRREHFCIFVDEFQNFASSEEFATLITEARKFGVATTIAHQERYGQFGDNQKLLGATAAAANKVFFQLTVKDAQELAPEFAEKADETKSRLGGELVNSPHVIEDIWERGHPDQKIMYLREKYFWVVDLLKSKPQESYHLFDAKNAVNSPQNQHRLKYENFDDWEEYRSSREMLRQGISLLNKYYYDCQQSGLEQQIITDSKLQLFHKIIECFSGVYGFRPTMQPYIPDEMRHLFLRRANEYVERHFRESVEEMRRKNQAREHDYTQYDREHPNRISGIHAIYEGEMPYGAIELEKIIKDHKPTGWVLADIPSSPSIKTVEIIRNYAIRVGFTQSEMNELIQWQIRPVNEIEDKALAEFVKITTLMAGDYEGFLKNRERVNSEYIAIMAHPLMALRLGENYIKMPEEQRNPDLQIVSDRIFWQMTELQFFIMYCLGYLPALLGTEPIKVQSAHYEEAPKREVTQSELITQMSQELIALPRFSSYAKVLQERDHKQVVLRQKIETYPMRPLPDNPLEPEIIELMSMHARYYNDRDEIEAEIRERQERWRRGEESGKSPARRRRKPPPTSE